VATCHLATLRLPEWDFLLRDWPRSWRDPEVRMVHDAQNQTRNADRDFRKDGGPGSEIESDETFVGGKAKNMSAKRRAQFKVARETFDGRRGPSQQGCRVGRAGP